MTVIRAGKTLRVRLTVDVPVDIYSRIEREKDETNRSMSSIANDIFATHYEAMDEENIIDDDINTHGGDRYGSL